MKRETDHLRIVRDLYVQYKHLTSVWWADLPEELEDMALEEDEEEEEEEGEMGEVATRNDAVTAFKGHSGACDHWTSGCLS